METSQELWIACFDCPYPESRDLRPQALIALNIMKKAPLALGQGLNCVLNAADEVIE
jgi:hypothetical protein